MKSSIILIVFSMVLSQSVNGTAVAFQDFDRINNLVNQARALADGARSDSSQSATIGLDATQQNNLKNPFSRASDTIAVPAAGAAGVEVDGNSIRINAGGRQLEIPRVGGTHGPNAVVTAGRTAANMGHSANVGNALEMANNYRVFADAVRSFRSGDYALALATMQRVRPDDKGAMDPFNSLCQFANGQYISAAESAYAAASRSQIYSWDQLRGYYGNPESYSQQYQKLQDAVAGQHSNPSLRFLLGYHHLMLGHRQHAAQEFEFVLTQLPSDAVIQNLLTVAQQMPPSPAN